MILTYQQARLSAMESEETPIQRQARIRREKREKKILEGGSTRLDKIMKVDGRKPDFERT